MSDHLLRIADAEGPLIRRSIWTVCMMASSQKKMSLDGDDSLLDDDVVDESLWESPVKPVEKHTQRSEPSGNHGHSARATYVDQQAREETLRQELASVRKVNEAIESVIESLEKAKENMKVVHGWHLRSGYCADICRRSIPRSRPHPLC